MGIYLFKGAPYVEAAYLTGILPIKKYGQHSALNLFDEYSIAMPVGLAGLMGFNDAEVRDLCVRFGMDYSQMAHWYDGYQLGLDRIHVYNHNSVARAIRGASTRATGRSPRPTRHCGLT